MEDKNKKEVCTYCNQQGKIVSFIEVNPPNLQIYSSFVKSILIDCTICQGTKIKIQRYIDKGELT